VRTLIAFVQAAAQATQHAGPPPGPPAGPPRGFSYREAFFQLVQFVGYFLAIGALGFRFGIVRRVRISDEAKRILRADNAALLGIIGVLLLFVSYLGASFIGSITEHKTRLSALWTTSYGITLITKLVFVFGVVVMGAWNWQRVRPSLGESGSEETIRRSATMELSFGALVLLATSVLVTLPSPK
jgi:putative copper export protein